VKKFTFNKQEKLISRKEIQFLFSEGSVFNSYPFRVLWRQLTEGDPGLKFAISVPKKNFKRAVDRNLLKRRTREAFRLQKPVIAGILEEKSKSLSLFLIYTSNEIKDYKTIEKGITQVIYKLKVYLSK
jgi:ribonuclease P protein component